MINSSNAVFENVRRYRTIASLYRQTAARRAHLRLSLLDQAEIWEHRAVVELEAYFDAQGQDDGQDDARWRVFPVYARSEMRAAA
jgi:hypothetical protein